MKKLIRIILLPLSASVFLSMNWSPENGLLTSEDLRNVKSRSENGFWRCFYANDVSISCLPMIDDSENPPAEVGILFIEAAAPGIHFTFDARRSWPMEFCQSKLVELNDLMAGEEHVCLASDYGMVEEGGRSIAAVFDKLKTHRGCYSYFVTPECPDPDDAEE